MPTQIDSTKVWTTWATTSASTTCSITWSSWCDVIAWYPVEQAVPPNDDAKQRAEALLVENLSEAQRAEYAKDRFFTVEGAKSKRRYRIRRGRVQNIDELSPSGEVVARYCVHPGKYVPDEDTMLAQKLHLEHDDEALLRVANRVAA